jgi:hypothetical protein
VRKLVILLAALALGNVRAADVQAVTSTQGALEGALEGALKRPVSVTQYVPGYGLHLAMLEGITTSQDEAISTIKGLLVALVPTVKGLDPSDWVSVGYLENGWQIIVRVRPFDLTVIEVWVDGVQR